MSAIAKLMRAELGVKIHWSFDGVTSLCNRGFKNPLEEVKGFEGCSSYICRSCASSMRRMVLVSEKLAHEENERVDNMAGCSKSEGCTRVAQHSGSCVPERIEVRVPDMPTLDEVLAAGAIARIVKTLQPLLCSHGITRGHRCSVCADV